MLANIFSISAKEFTHEAFFTWLLSCATPKHAKDYPHLQKKACDFIQLLTGYSKPIQSVEVKRQWKYMDICAWINEEVFLVIEDKIHRHADAAKLQRYKQLAEIEAQAKGLKLVLVYLKTEDTPHCEQQEAQSNGFHFVSRPALLHCLSTGEQVAHGVYTEFVRYLKELESHSKAYSEKAVQDWTSANWQGFFQAIEGELDALAWRYIPNRHGGYYALSWPHKNWQGYEVHLDIQSGKEPLLRFIVERVNENKKHIRTTLSEGIIKFAKERGIDSLTVPKRVGNGKTMSFAVAPAPHWIGDTSKVIDLPKVLAHIKSYEQLFELFVEEEKNLELKS